VEDGEECDDGNTKSNDGCNDSCKTELPLCGNGALEEGEQCDDADSSVQTTIDQGTSAVFVLQASIINPQVTSSQTSTLQVTLEQFADLTQTGMASGLSHMRWVDTDASTQQQYWWVEYPDTIVKSTSYQY